MRKIILALIVLNTGLINAYADNSAPTPDPSTWSVEPFASSESSISMTATTASDPSGVEYQFSCEFYDGEDFEVYAWQSSPEFTVSGLAANGNAFCSVKTRDTSPAQNTGSASPYKGASVTDYSPEPPASSTVLLNSLNFEAGFDTWTHGGGDVKWFLRSGTTPSNYTGPTSGSIGSATTYAFIETSESGAFIAGQDAIIESPVISGSDREMKVRYHMFGENTGSLNIDVYSNGSWTNGELTRTGQIQLTTEQSYKVAVLDLSAYTGDIKVRLRAVAAGGSKGDIAIDEVEIFGSNDIDTQAPLPTAASWAVAPYADNGSIHMTATTATDPSGVEYQFSCEFYDGEDFEVYAWQSSPDFTVNGLGSGGNAFCSVKTRDLSAANNTGTASAYKGASVGVELPVTLASLDFEAGFANWTHGAGYTNLTLGSDSTPSIGTGPTSGSTGSPDNYAFLETSGSGANNAGEDASLESPVITGSDREMKFRYHMFGDNIGSLIVDVYSNGAWINGVLTRTGEIQLTTEQSWKVVTMDLSSYSGDIKVRFRAVAVGGYKGDISIDEIEIKGNH